MAFVPEPAPWPARWKASGWDYLVITGWLLTITGIAAVVVPVLPSVTASQSPAVTDTIAFSASVFPAWVYLTLTEGGPRRATWGKRRSGLHVVTAGGTRP